MNEVTMNMDRFRRLAETFGGDLSRWPAGEIRSAADLAATSPEAAAILEGERLVDGALDAAALAMDEALDDERTSRVLDAIGRRMDERVEDGSAPSVGEAARRPSMPLPVKRSRGYLSAGFLSAMAVFGLVLGALDPHTSAEDRVAATTASPFDETTPQSVAALYVTRPRYFVSWNQ